MGKNTCFSTVSIWDRSKLHVLSAIFGAWTICGMLLKWMWDPKRFLAVQQRDNPPPCLVDSSLGQHKYVKLKGVKFHYVESGSKDQPVALLLHGFPDCWLSWRHQIPLLAQHFRVIALDLKGFGDSDKPSRISTYRIDTLLEELKQLITSLGVTKCVVIGHDIGALLGWYLAQYSPDLIDKLVVISSPHPNIYRRTLHTTSNYKWLNFVQLPYFPEVEALHQDIHLISEHHSHLPPKDTYLEAYKYSFSRKEDWTGPLNYFRNFPYVELSEKLDLIQVPVFLITGNRDGFVKLENVVKSTDYCDRFHVKIIDGGGHFPHQECPVKFNEILVKYLVRRTPARKNLDRSLSKGLMDKMFGAVTSTVKYGNSVLDSVQKNGKMVGMSTIPLLNYSLYDKTDSA